MATPTSTQLPQALKKAQDPKAYQNPMQPLQDTISIVQAGLKECRAPNLADFREILAALGHGPFLCSTLKFKPHPAQRPIDERACRKLLSSLAGADQRDQFPIYVMVDTAFWESHPSPAPQAPLAVMTTEGCSDEYPQSFSHGHRIHALKMALEGSHPEDLELKDDILQIYGEDLNWVTYFIPSFLKDLLPPTFWFTHIMVQNTRDELLHGLTEAQGYASWVTYLHHLTTQLYHPHGPQTFSPPPVTAEQLGKLYTASKASHLSHNMAAIHGEQVLSHPKVLSALASGLALSAPRAVFTKAVLKAIKEANYWPVCTFLSLGAEQFSPMAQWSDRNWNEFLKTGGQKRIVKSSFSISQVEKETKGGYFLANLFKEGDYEGNKTRTAEFIKALLTGGDSVRLRSYNEAVRPHGSFRLACLEEKELAWITYCQVNSQNIRAFFKQLNFVLYLLVWVLVGPKYCSLIANLAKPGAGKPFSHFPWVHSPDGVILAYLRSAGAKRSGQELALPPSNHHIGQLYAEASNKDLDKLHQLALLLFDCGRDMLNAIPHSMRHLKQGQSPPSNQKNVEEDSYFYWAKQGPAIHPFHGTNPPTNPNLCLGSTLSPLTVYLDTPPAGLEEQHISCYAQAVRNVVQHPSWQTALYGILQVDQVVSSGEPWLLNPHATIIPFPNPAATAQSELSITSSAPQNTSEHPPQVPTPRQRSQASPPPPSDANLEDSIGEKSSKHTSPSQQGSQHPVSRQASEPSILEPLPLAVAAIGSPHGSQHLSPSARSSPWRYSPSSPKNLLLMSTPAAPTTPSRWSQSAPPCPAKPSSPVNPVFPGLPIAIPAPSPLSTPSDSPDEYDAPKSGAEGSVEAVTPKSPTTKGVKRPLTGQASDSEEEEEEEEEPTPKRLRFTPSAQEDSEDDMGQDEEVDQLRQSGVQNKEIARSPSVDWLKEVEAESMLQMNLSQMPAGASMRPLMELTVPAHVPMPDEKDWEHMDSNERDTVMRMLFNHFPAHLQPHLQRGVYAIMQTAEAVALKDSGEDAMRQWATRMEAISDKESAAIEQTIGHYKFLEQ